jgi:hypothetical protein
MDDPLSFGAIKPHAVLAAADAAGVPAVVITGVRSSDWAARDPSELYGAAELKPDWDLKDSLDDLEWGLLPGVVAKLGITQSYAEAQRYIAGTLSRQTRDTLNALYWLLPPTRDAINRSIRDEYFRLGDGAGLTQVIIGAFKQSSQTLQDAYAMAAVAEEYQAPLPLEVLVSALGVSYSDWLDTVPPDAPAWGLLYPSGGDDDPTIFYSTRNAIVTRIVIEAINGGTLSRSGELRILMRLLQGCTGTQGVYREFVMRLFRTSG